MATTKFIFLNRYLPTIGGPMPPNTTILGNYGDYYLGEIDSNLFHTIKYWEPMPVDDETAEGFKFLGVDQVPTDPSDPESEMRALTSNEKQLKAKALKALKKLETRHKLHAEVEDIYDIVADLWKRVTLNERLLLRLAKWIMDNNSNLPTKLTQYKTMVDSILAEIDEGLYKDRTDLEDPAEVLAKLRSRGQKMTEIVEEYLNYNPKV